MVSDDDVGELIALNDEVGPIGSLFESCVKLLRSLSTKARELDVAYCKSLESNLATLVFWDDEFGASSGHLDKALEYSEENRDLTLSTLISLGDFLSRGLLNAALPLSDDREHVRQRSSIHARVDQARGIIMDTEAPTREDADSIEDACDILDTKVARLNVLGPILEESTPPGVVFEQVAPHGQLPDRPAHQYYADLISVRFPNAHASLVEILGKCNWERYTRIYRRREENAQRDGTSIGETENKSKFHDSGLGTSVPSQSAFGKPQGSFSYAETEVSKRAEGSHRRLPPLPEEGRKGWPFVCEVCNNVVGIRRTHAWKKHIFSDVLAYVCFFDDCPSERCFFDDRDALTAHLGSQHGFAPTWQSETCPLCLEETGNGMNTISLHFARHMEEVALGAIPRTAESDAGSDESSSEALSEVTSTRVDGLDALEKGVCSIEGCGRPFRDLKAHILTHQTERSRPEKCPITTCEYHLKGFARKYDKNRHALTHYKGTMVCSFCPDFGSAAEKLFNRADVFKRHLSSVHGVEQTPPNSRKKSPTAKKAYTSNSTAGTCSTCSVTFANAQEFYEHLDDCVLRVIQQADPAEAINQKLLSSVADDEGVKETLDRHLLPNEIIEHARSHEDDEENNSHQPSYDDLQQASMQSNEGFSGHDVLNPLSEAGEEPISDTIKCACGYVADDGSSVLCEVCRTWQHVLCYYEDEEQIPRVHECIDCRPRAIDEARIRDHQRAFKNMTYMIERKPKRLESKSHKKKLKDMSATNEHVSESHEDLPDSEGYGSGYNDTAAQPSRDGGTIHSLKSHSQRNSPPQPSQSHPPLFEVPSQISDGGMAAHMAMKQVLMDQNHDRVEVPSNDDSDIRPVPKRDRTMTDIYADELFNPNTMIPAPVKQSAQSSQSSNTTLLSPFRDVLTDRLQAAHQARSKSPQNSSRGMDPFKKGSPLAPSSEPK